MRVLTLSVIAAAGLGLALLLSAAGVPAEAAEIGPRPWQLGFQPPSSPIMQRVNDLHDLLLWIITGITLLVLGLMVYACWRFHEGRNPVPA